MVSVPDAGSVAAAAREQGVGAPGGPADGHHQWGAFGLLAEMVANGRGAPVVTLLADSGDRYADTYYRDEWVANAGWTSPSGHPR